MKQVNGNDSGVQLSVIMPIYNVEDTIALALESVLMQQTDFNYEIIVVDDCSTDKTLDVVEQYAEKYAQIKIIKHIKNQGNALSFYDGLSASSGKYFCVLDGDDYYTVKNKLQKQVDFLNGDVDCDYTAVAHKYLRVDKNGDVYDDAQLFFDVNEYTYNNFLKQKFYYHTSTYMYRNIFKGNVPECFKDGFFRGDNPRTFLHLLFTRGKVKVLNFVGSVYVYTEKGIWSHMSLSEQKERNINMLRTFQDKCFSETEKACLSYVIDARCKQALVKQKLCFIPKEDMLVKLFRVANRYAFNNPDFVFKSLYKSTFIDSFCESIGFVAAVSKHLLPLSTLPKNKEEHILITISNLTTTGGGVYYEIIDIIKMYADKKIYLLITDVDDRKHLNEKVLEQLEAFDNLIIVFGQSAVEGKLNKLVDAVIKINPIKIYHYLGHNNVFAAALVQSVYGKNINVFSFDHGFSLGLDNTSYSAYIVKRPTDYALLSKYYKDKVIYIPCWNEDKIGENGYVPFKNHSHLVTATGAARYYKLSREMYIKLILCLLKNTKGKHIHYGPIDEDVLKNIYQKMDEEGLASEQFVHIPWADNLGRSMYENEVDIFIEPFPIVSYKLSLEVLSAGIPIIVRRAVSRMEITDFVYEDVLLWNDEQDFIKVLSGLTKDGLIKHSKFSREYYVNNHLPEKLLSSFAAEKNFKEPAKVVFYDRNICNIDNVVDFLNNTGGGMQFFAEKILNNSPKVSTVRQLKYQLMLKVYNKLQKKLRKKGLVK